MGIVAEISLFGDWHLFENRNIASLCGFTGCCQTGFPIEWIGALANLNSYGWCLHQVPSCLLVLLVRYLNLIDREVRLVGMKSIINKSFAQILLGSMAVVSVLGLAADSGFAQSAHSLSLIHI